MKLNKPFWFSNRFWLFFERGDNGGIDKLIMIQINLKTAAQIADLYFLCAFSWDPNLIVRILRATNLISRHSCCKLAGSFTARNILHFDGAEAQIEKLELLLQTVAR